MQISLEAERPHRGAVRERSQGLRLRKPWIDSIDPLHPGGMREKTTRFTRSFSCIPPGCTLSHNATRGFEDSTPGYDLLRLRRKAIPKNVQLQAPGFSLALPDLSCLSIPSIRLEGYWMLRSGIVLRYNTQAWFGLVSWFHLDMDRDGSRFSVAISSVISVIDDDSSMCRMLSRLISSAGLNVASFNSAEEFLASGRLDDSSCLILDVDLPGMSGIDLQRQLNDSGVDVPIIFISGKQVGSTREHALSEGAAGFFHKPFSIESLLNAIQAVGR